MTVHFETLGCKLNQIESESAAKAFFDSGYDISSKNLTRAAGIQEAVIIAIVNTCTVTSKAEQKARRTIQLLLDLCPNAAVIVTGCYAELDGNVLKALDERIVLLKGSQKGLLVDIARQFSPETVQPHTVACTLQQWIEAQNGRDNKDRARLAFALSTDTLFSRSRASLKIQDGCNNACSYCRVRLARG